MSHGRQPDATWSQELLAHVSADCSREDWIRVGAAIKAGLDGDGWTVFEGWSQTAPNLYNAADCRRAWDSLSPDGGVTWGTLVALAKAGGWRPPADTAVTTHWVIRGPNGTPAAVHYRKDLPDGSKRQWWERPNGARGLGGRKTAMLPLYGTELLAGATAATTAVIVEGEKCADALRAAEPSLLVLGTVTGAQSCPARGRVEAGRGDRAAGPVVVRQ